MFSIKYMEPEALGFATIRYKIDLEAILFSAPAVAPAGSTGQNIVQHIHQKLDFLKNFHYMPRIVQNRFRNRI